MPINALITDRPEEQISKLLAIIGQPARIQILLIIGEQAACVCHIHTALGMRQASISQHLMALRKAGLVSTQRSGRNIFYQLTHPEVIDVLKQAAQLTGIHPDTFQTLTMRPMPGCPCPQCHPEGDTKRPC